VCFAALRFRPHADRADRSTHAAARAARASRSSAESSSSPIQSIRSEDGIELWSRSVTDVRISGITSTKATEARRTAPVTHDDVTV
jgi:hypothetical protein